MRCPKCGYTSFDHLDRCKSCGEDLVPAKIKLNIYSKHPKIEIDEEGFVVGRVSADKKNLLEGQDISAADVISEDGEKLESFDFSDDK